MTISAEGTQPQALPEARPQPQITVLDAGGQYCHLIARKVRDLGVYAEVRPSDTPAPELRECRGIIISGGPASVYEAGSPTIDAAILTAGPGVLGICYGLQLIAHALGGAVRKGDKGEYGLARLKPLREHPLFEGVDRGESQVWMSHRDKAETAPPGFDVLASTETCAIAAMAHRDRPVAAVQFHPEVVHTSHGREILTNFVFGMCGCVRDWDPKDRIPLIETEIRARAAGRNIFFFVSGGVDSTVAYKLCLRALGPERVYGIYVDTGLMREGETEHVRRLFATLGATAFRVEDASASFLGKLAGLTEPEDKRKAIGEEFVDVQDRVLRTEHFLDANWVLGQGTIYPDTIESGGTKNADLIKTHHNRVAGIQQLIAAGRLVEPLSSFYKDEVREIGQELGIPDEFLSRHPFPGPGLAIRCLCSASEHKIVDQGGCWMVPVRTVGVQGDSRTYRGVLAFEELIPEDKATDLVNQSVEVNRVVGRLGSHVPVSMMRVTRAYITGDRLARLRRADAIVRALTHESGFDKEVWQLPVVLMPLGTGDLPDAAVLRPIHSVDGMTAKVVLMPQELRREVTRRLLEVEGVCGVFYDLTHKPPGTIEWE